jgi:nitrate/nitrite transporter NarK
MNAAGNVGGVLAPLVTGFTIQRTGSYVPAFLTAAGVLLLGIAAYALVVPSLDSASEAPSQDASARLSRIHSR